MCIRDSSVGLSSDLSIYHSGSHSYIDETGTGNLYIRNGSKNSIFARSDGEVILYHNDSSKFKTAETGAVVTGILTATTGTFTTGITTSLRSNKISVGDDEFINVGLGSDLQLYHNGSNSYIDNSTGITFIRNTGTNGSQIQLLNNLSLIHI